MCVALLRSSCAIMIIYISDHSHYSNEPKMFSKHFNCFGSERIKFNSLSTSSAISRVAQKNLLKQPQKVSIENRSGENLRNVFANRRGNFWDLYDSLQSFPDAIKQL